MKTVIAFLFTLFFGFSLASAATYDCGNCTDCSGYIQNASNDDTIRLMQNLSGISGNCIDFGGQDNVTFDCQGHYIEGIGGGYGILLDYSGSDSSDNNTIKNCNIKYFQNGILLRYAENNTLINISLTINLGTGISMHESLNNILTNITVNSSTYGIWFNSSRYNVITNSTFIDNDYYDFYPFFESEEDCMNIIENITGSGGREIVFYNSSANIQNKELSELILCNADHSKIENVTVSGSDSINNNAVFLYKTDHSEFTGINASYNYRGLRIEESSNNTYINISASFNKGGTVVNQAEGFAMFNSHNNTFINITANTNGFGFYFVGSSNNTMVNITSDSNAQYSIVFVIYSSNNTIQNLNTWNCSTEGSYSCVMFSASDNNELKNAYINDSSNDGIRVGGSSNNSFFWNIDLENIDVDDIYLGPNAKNNTFLNVTYADENVNTDGELIRKWYAEVNVTNSTGDSVVDINISFYNSSSVLIDYNETNSSGLTKKFELTEYVNTGGTRSYWTNYTLYANDSNYTYNNYTSSVNFTTNIQITVNMTEIDKIPPQIFNVTNGSVYATQAYVMWNTSEPANSTILFGTNQNSLINNITNSSLVVSHNLTAYPLTKNTTYFYNVTSCDAAGNCNSSGTYNFTTLDCTENWTYSDWSSCIAGYQSREAEDLNNCGTTDNRSALAQTCTLDSGTGGGGSSTTPSTQNKTYSVLYVTITPTEGAILTVNKEEIGIKQVNIFVKNPVSNVRVTVTKLDSQPTSVTHSVKGNLYQFLDMTATNLEETNILDVKVQFKVKKSWLSDNNVNDSTVKLNRYDMIWEELETNRLNEDSENIYYEATSPGFSVYAITGEAFSAAPQETPGQSQQICVANETRCNTNMETCKSDGSGWEITETCAYGCTSEGCNPPPSINWTAIIAAVVIIAAVIVSTLFLRFRGLLKKPRKKPDKKKSSNINPDTK